MKERLKKLGDRTGERGRQLFRAQPRAAAAGLVVVAVLVWTVGLSAAWLTYEVGLDLPERDAISGIGQMDQATAIFDRNDQHVFTIFKEQRLEVGLEDVSPHVIKAVLSAEDQRFYSHEGVDFVRVVGALMRNIREGRKAEGGSTVTQQLARTSFLSTDKTYRRKLKEVVLAAQIENTYTKDQILEMYLNKVYFGDGLYGVEAAARGFFGKTAKDLTVAESAMLIGLIKSPSTWAPTINLERAVARRNIVLDTMIKAGKIDEEEYKAARKEPVKLKDSLSVTESFGLYYKEQVRQELVERFGWERVYQGGLRVYTALDAGMQQAAEKHVEQWLAQLEKRPGFRHPSRGEALKAWNPERGAPDYLQGALMAADPRTGEVRVLVGGRSFRESKFNRAVQAKRQAGSAFKPFLYAAALERGASPGTIITNLDSPIATPQGAWVPSDDHSEGGSMTMRTALRTSSNRAAAQMIRTVGVDTTVEYAKRLELGDMPAVPSLALGAGDVTLADMTMAFGAFANGGYVRDPILIRKVVDRDGTVLYEAEDLPKKAIEEATAFFMADMLTDVVDHGTGYGARREGFRLPAAGKTGTTNDYVDGWFVGFTPSLVAGVWVGFDKPKTIFNGGYAAQVAVPIWARFMRDATRGDKAEWFERPKDIVAVAMCRVSGKRATDGCRAGEIVYDDFGNPTSRSFVVTQYYRESVVPSEYCDLHFAYDSHGLPISPGASVPEGSSALPPPVDLSAPAPFPAPAASEDARARDAKEAEKKKEEGEKRGFWGRIFRGDAKTVEERRREQEEQIRREAEKKRQEAEKKAREEERRRLERERREAEQRERERREAEREEERRPPPPAPTPKPAPKPPVCCEG